jgi:hypothetical protein
MMRRSHGTVRNGRLLIPGRVERPLRSTGTIVEIIE